MSTLFPDLNMVFGKGETLVHKAVASRYFALGSAILCYGVYIMSIISASSVVFMFRKDEFVEALKINKKDTNFFDPIALFDPFSAHLSNIQVLCFYIKTS